jgi:hypothetical protein
MRLSEMTHRSQIRDHAFKFEPEFSKSVVEIKAEALGKWIGSTIGSRNLQPRHLGCELEIECLDGADLAELTPIPERFLRGLYSWKYDGSLVNGAELVTDAMTLKRWSAVDLKALCSALKKKGRSYESGRCGFHIHVNRTSLMPHAAESASSLVGYNAEFFKTFSARSDLSFCQISGGNAAERWFNGERYKAVHPTSQTIEFRLWRGTLYWKRLRASILMTDAICSYVNQASRIGSGMIRIASDRRVRAIRRQEIADSMRLYSFLEFIGKRPEYQFLANYLKAKNLWCERPRRSVNRSFNGRAFLGSLRSEPFETQIRQVSALFALASDTVIQIAKQNGLYGASFADFRSTLAGVASPAAYQQLLIGQTAIALLDDTYKGDSEALERHYLTILDYLMNRVARTRSGFDYSAISARLAQTGYPPMSGEKLAAVEALIQLGYGYSNPINVGSSFLAVIESIGNDASLIVTVAKQIAIEEHQRRNAANAIGASPWDGPSGAVTFTASPAVIVNIPPTEPTDSDE